MGMWHMYICTI